MGPLQWSCRGAVANCPMQPRPPVNCRGRLQSACRTLGCTGFRRCRRDARPRSSTLLEGARAEVVRQRAPSQAAPQPRHGRIVGAPGSKWPRTRTVPRRLLRRAGADGQDPAHRLLRPTLAPTGSAQGPAGRMRGHRPGCRQVRWLGSRARSLPIPRRRSAWRNHGCYTWCSARGSAVSAWHGPTHATGHLRRDGANAGRSAPGQASRGRHAHPGPPRRRHDRRAPAAHGLPPGQRAGTLPTRSRVEARGHRRLDLRPLGPPRGRPGRVGGQLVRDQSRPAGRLPGGLPPAIGGDPPTQPGVRSPGGRVDTTHERGSTNRFDDPERLHRTVARVVEAAMSARYPGPPVPSDR